MTGTTTHKLLGRVWAVVFAVVVVIVLLFFFAVRTGRTPAPGFGFVEDGQAGTLTVMDGDRPVLTYRFGDQLPAGVDPKQARSCYVHPLYSLDGAVMTADFPEDHLHHHGLFWTWPDVHVRGEATQTWHPADPPLRQHFVRWIERETSEDGALLVVANAWKLRESEVVAEETVSILVHAASALGRAVDVEILLRPFGGPMELRGAAEADKGYGGLCLRGAPALKGAALTTDAGPLEQDSTGRPFRWADMSTPGSGVAVFVSPDHPGFPVAWLARNSYAGVLNPSWPGLGGATLPEGVPVSLRYRVYVHRGDARAGRVEEAYAAFLTGRGR